MIVSNRVGRPRVDVDPIILLELRAQGFSWALIQEALGHHRNTLSNIAFRYLKRDTPRVEPNLYVNPVMRSMITDLQSGWRPTHKQLLCYTAFLNQGRYKRYFVPLRFK